MAELIRKGDTGQIDIDQCKVLSSLLPDVDDVSEHVEAELFQSVVFIECHRCNLFSLTKETSSDWEQLNDSSCWCGTLIGLDWSCSCDGWCDSKSVVNLVVFARG